MTPEEQAAYRRAVAVVEHYQELTGSDSQFVSGLLQDLATYQRKVGVASLALLAQSAELVDKRRARLV